MDDQPRWTVAVVGAGQLGSRYLQSLVATLRNQRVFVVDPGLQSLTRAETLIAGPEYQLNRNEVTYHTSVEGLPSSIDLVVVATTADVRLAILKTLVPGRHIGALVLEKVLFQSVGDLAEAEGLLQRNKIATWVNCSRRVFPLWRIIRDYFGGEIPLRFYLTGGEWGLACNAIHFLDVASYVTGAVPTVIDLSGIESEMVDAKRAGFKEIFGTLVASYGDGSSVSLESRSGSKEAHCITIVSETKTAVVDEAQGIVLLRGQGRWEAREAPLPYLSAFMGPLLRDLLANGHCELPTLVQSATLHRPLLEALSMKFSRETLPIT